MLPGNSSHPQRSYVSIQRISALVASRTTQFQLPMQERYIRSMPSAPSQRKTLVSSVGSPLIDIIIWIRSLEWPLQNLSACELICSVLTPLFLALLRRDVGALSLALRLPDLKL